MPIPCFFHTDQLAFKPAYEWAFGRRIDHPETTARAENILAALTRDSAFDLAQPDPIGRGLLAKTHSRDLLTLYETACTLGEDETFYPSVFPKRAIGKGDPTRIRHAGAFCFDSGTPLCRNTSNAARWSAACAVAAARSVRAGKPLSYALSRPPGHHATREFFGGYSYFNNSAIAAKVLRRTGKVAILDIDFHHGNGTQTIFERDPKVLTISVHGHPDDFYPFFCGFEQENGRAAGVGYNVNRPLPAGTDGDQFVAELEHNLLPLVSDFEPRWLVVAAGFDTYELDPVGDFRLVTDDYLRVGRAIRQLGLPTVVVQEGGYFAAHLGQNVAALLGGLAGG